MPGSFRSTGARRGRCPLLRRTLFPATAAAIDGAEQGTASRRAHGGATVLSATGTRAGAPRPPTRQHVPGTTAVRKATAAGVPSDRPARRHGRPLLRRSSHPAQQHAPRQHTRPQTPQPPQPKPPTHPPDQQHQPGSTAVHCSGALSTRPGSVRPGSTPGPSTTAARAEAPAHRLDGVCPRWGGRRGATGARAGVLGLPSLGSPVPFAGLGGPLGRPGPCLCGRPGLCRSSATASRGRRWRWCARPGG